MEGRGRSITGLDPSAHVVNQPRRSGTMTEEQGRRFLEAFNPESAIEPITHSLYESGHPELSGFPHGQPRRPMERPGFLPTSIRNTMPGGGFFHTGAPGDRIVGQPHPTPQLPPERRKPFGFYEETANWPPSNHGSSDDIYRIGGHPLTPDEGRRWLDEVAARRAQSSDSDARPGNPQGDIAYGGLSGHPMFFPGRGGGGGADRPARGRPRAGIDMRGRRGHFGNVASIEEMRERSARREAEQRAGQAGADTHPVYARYDDENRRPLTTRQMGPVNDKMREIQRRREVGKLARRIDTEDPKREREMRRRMNNPMGYEEDDDRRQRWTEIMQGNLYPQHDLPSFMRPFGGSGDEETGQAVGFFPKKWEEMQGLSGAADPYCMYGPNVPSFDVQSGKWGWRNPDVNPNFGTSRYPQPGVDDDAEEGFNNPNLYPLGRTQANVDDDYAEWLGGGGMGNYSQYGDEYYDPIGKRWTTDDYWKGYDPVEERWSEGPHLNQPQGITDEFGREYPPQIPTPRYSEYAGPPTWRQGLIQRDQWNKFWSTPGTDDYRAPYPQGEQDPRQGGPTMEYPVHEPDRPLSQPYPGNYAWTPGQPVSPSWSHESSHGNPDAEAWRAWNRQQIIGHLNQPRQPRVDDMDHPHRTRDLRDVPNPIVIDDYSRYAAAHQPPGEDEYYDFSKDRWVKQGDPDYNYVEEPEEIESDELDYSCGGDMTMGCRYMQDMLESMKPTLYDEGMPEIGDTPDRDYWRKKTPYADQPSSHMDMSSGKARRILHDGEVHGHPLTNKQRGLFGSIAGRG